MVARLGVLGVVRMAGDMGDDGITRWQLDGRVHRWQRPGSAWPGHVTFVALRGGQVVLGDRYAGDGVERTYACEARELLEGCFHAQVTEQLGARVLEELLAEVRRELGVSAAGPARSRAAEAPQSTAKPQTAAKTPANEPEPRSAPSPASAASGAAAPATDVSAQTETVDVTVTACATASLPLVVALRGLTRAPVGELLSRLGRLPCTVLAGASRAEAERAREQLCAHGVSVALVPAAR